MRIAVMADIHSNHIALETCFAQAQRRHAEEFIFLGDYLGDLAYPQKTLEFLGGIKKQYPCTFIRGNKEDYWIHHKNGLHLVRLHDDAVPFYGNSCNPGSA